MNRREQLAAWITVVLFMGSALMMVALVFLAVTALQTPATASHGVQGAAPVEASTLVPPSGRTR
jgi:hypothetical protein